MDVSAQRSIEGKILTALVSSGNNAGYDANFLKPSNDKFIFIDLVLQSDSEIRTLGTNESISFKNCLFNGSLTISPNAHSTSLEFENCKFHHFTKFSQGRENNLSFKRCEFNNLFIVSGTFKHIQIQDSKGKCSLQKTKFETFQFGSWTTPEKNHFDRLDFSFVEDGGSVQIIRSEIGYLNINDIIPVNSTVIIDTIVVKHFELSWLAVKGSLRVNNLKVAELPIDRYSHVSHSEKEKEKINVYYSGSIFLLNKSDLGKAHFSSINLRDFQFVNIGESNVAEVNFTNMIWPRTIYPFPHILRKDIGDYMLRLPKLTKQEKLNTREVYRQLKLSCGKNSDTISEQYFHGKEMDAYDASLRWRDAFWIKLVLRLSSITSNYGQSIWRPLTCLVVLTSLMLIILYNTHNGAYKSCDFERPSNFWEWLSEFLRLANPLHANNCKLRGFAFVTDSILRVLSSYFIYNLVRASRRFVK